MLARFARADHALLEGKMSDARRRRNVNLDLAKALRKPVTGGPVYFFASATMRFSLPANAALLAEDMRSINKIPFR